MGASNSLSLSLSDLAQCFLHCEARGVPFISSNFWRSRVYVRHTKKKRKKGRKKQFENVFSVRGEERSSLARKHSIQVPRTGVLHASIVSNGNVEKNTSKLGRWNWAGVLPFERSALYASETIDCRPSKFRGFKGRLFFFFLSLFFNSRARHQLLFCKDC